MPITIKQSVVVIGRRGRSPDLDAATDIMRLIKEGKVVTVHNEPSNGYTISMYWVDGFSIQFRPHWYSEDARLLDLGDYGFEEPDWAPELTALIRKLSPKETECPPSKCSSTS